MYMYVYFYTTLRVVIAYGQRALWPAWTDTKAWLHPRFFWCSLTFTTFVHLSDNRGTSKPRARLEGRWNQELKTDKGYLNRRGSVGCDILCGKRKNARTLSDFAFMFCFALLATKLKREAPQICDAHDIKECSFCSHRFRGTSRRQYVAFCFTAPHN